MTAKPIILTCGLLGFACDYGAAAKVEEPVPITTHSDQHEDRPSCVDSAPPPLTLAWAALSKASGPVEGVPANELELVATSAYDTPLRVELRFLVDVGSPQTHTIRGPQLAIGPGEQKSFVFDLSAVALPVERMQTSGMLYAAARVIDAKNGNDILAAVSPTMYWHYGSNRTLLNSKESGRLTVYDERTHEKMYRGGDVQGLVPDAVLADPAGNGRVVPSRVFIGDVAIVTPGRTTPAELVARGLIPVTEPIVDAIGQEVTR